MKRLILTALIAAGAVMAQTPATGTAPATSNTQSTQKPAVKRHAKKAKTAKKPDGAFDRASPGCQAEQVVEDRLWWGPVSKRGRLFFLSD